MTQIGSQPVAAPQHSGPGGLIRLRLRVAYDGTAFHGWARQPGLRTVQADLESALRAVLRIDADVPVRVAVAGRTDAGVHALGQICHCDVPAPSLAGLGPRDGSGGPSSPPERLGLLSHRLNGILAADLWVRDVAAAPTGFDARWSAAWREYRYLVSDSQVSWNPLHRGHVLWSPSPLDVAAMDVAAQPFRGEHDFAAFCRARTDASSVRTIQFLQWRREPAGIAVFTVRADAFCHSMVRSMVGALLAVGLGRWPVDRPARLLQAGGRVPEIPVAPAHGLSLVRVGYPDDADLAQQASRARRWRGDDASRHPAPTRPT